MAPGTAPELPAHPALGTSRCHPASWKYPELPNPASGDMTGTVHTVARACPQRCLPDKKLSAATCAHPAGSGHRTEGSAPTTMPSAAQTPPQTSPQKKPNLEPAAGSPKPHLSPFPTGRAGGKQSGCRDAPGPPVEGLLHRVGAHAGVHVPGKHGEPGHLVFSGSGVTSMHRCSPAPTWAHGKDGGSDAPRPREPQAWRWLQAGKGWKLNVMGHEAEGSDAGE